MIDEWLSYHDGGLEAEAANVVVGLRGARMVDPMGGCSKTADPA